jgi:hypothetical protein
MPERLRCPACSSHGVKPSSKQLPFDRLYGLFGRVPYDCVWCGARSHLVPTGTHHVPDVPAKPELTPSPFVPPDRGPDPMPEARAAVVTPEPDPPAPEPAPPEKIITISRTPGPAVHAERGRLRLSDMAMDQIQWRGKDERLLGAVQTNGKHPKS